MNKAPALVTILWVVSVRSAFPQVPIREDADQYVFSANDETMQHPISLPSRAFAMVARDQSLASLLEGTSVAREKVPESWFVASVVHLASKNEGDLIVMGVGPVRGANVTTFWLLRPKGEVFELLLTATAHTLKVTQARSNGYRDVELVSATAVRVSTSLFTFRAGTYQRVSVEVRDLK
jgi:hypothetical protein